MALILGLGGDILDLLCGPFQPGCLSVSCLLTTARPARFPGGSAGTGRGASPRVAGASAFGVPFALARDHPSHLSRISGSEAQ